MYVTANFVFIHLERTGGNFFNNFLRKFFPDGFGMVGYHYPRVLTPKEFRPLPVIGLIRNPWDWYVSQYSHKQIKIVGVPGITGCRNNLPLGTLLFGQLFDAASFENTTRTLLNLGKPEEPYITYRQGFIDAAPHTIEGNRAVGVTKLELASLAPGLGWYSWLARRMFADACGKYEDVRLGRFESLASEIERLLEEVGVIVTDGMREALVNSPPPNPSQRSEYRDYYTAALRKEVAQQDGSLIEQFGYSF